MTSPKTRRLPKDVESERYLKDVERVFGVSLPEVRGLEEHIECLERKAQDLAESNKDLRYLLILMAFAWLFVALYFVDTGMGYYSLIPTLLAGICLWGGIE